MAELTLDSDQAPDVKLLVTAARDAIALTNITLGERLARAAVSRGGGLDASELLARSLLWQGKAAESEETLSLFDPDTMTEVELVRWEPHESPTCSGPWATPKAPTRCLNCCAARSPTLLRLLVDGVASASLLLRTSSTRQSHTANGSSRIAPHRRSRSVGGLWWHPGTGADGAC